MKYTKNSAELPVTGWRLDVDESTAFTDWSW